MFWEIVIAAAVLLGLCIVGMCFNIIFRKNGQFPETEISRNKDMRRLGIRCAKEEELRLRGKKNGKANPTCADLGCGDCAGCAIIKKSTKK